MLYCGQSWWTQVHDTHEARGEATARHKTAVEDVLACLESEQLLLRRGGRVRESTNSPNPSTAAPKLGRHVARPACVIAPPRGLLRARNGWGPPRPIAYTPRQAKLDSIPAGKLHYPRALRIFGEEEEPLLRRVTADLTDAAANVEVEVRGYPDWADGRDVTDGYYVLWKTRLVQAAPHAVCDLPAKLPGDGMVQVWAKGSEANSSVSITMEGKRKRPRTGWFW